MVHRPHARSLSALRAGSVMNLALGVSPALATVIFKILLRIKTKKMRSEHPVF